MNTYKKESYYSILGLDNTATSKDIKKAYRTLALQCHPDRNNKDEYQFKKITEAYETLNDPEKKILYDNPQSQFNIGNNFPFFNNDFNNMMNQFNSMNQEKKNKGNCPLCKGVGYIKEIIDIPGLRMEKTTNCYQCSYSGN